MPTVNASFEIAGAAPGQAASWTLASASTATDVATPDATAEGREDFEEGWRLPMGTPFAENMGSFNPVTQVFTDEAAHVAGVRPVLYMRVLVQLSEAVLFTVTYTDDVTGAGRTGTVTVAATAPVGSNWRVALQGADSAPIDVTAITSPGAIAAGSVRVVGVRGVVATEGTFGNRESNSGALFNESATFAFTDPALAVAAFSHGLDFEHFEFAWDGNDATIHDDFDAEVSAAASFDAAPALASGAESVEDFEEGWWRVQAETVRLATYRISNNAFAADQVAAVTVGAPRAYPTATRPRARLTEIMGPAAQTLDVTYRRWVGDGVQVATVRLPASAAVGQLYGFNDVDQQVHAVTAAAEQVDLAQFGQMDIEVDEIPAEADLTDGTAAVSLAARLTIGTGTGAVLYEARAVGFAGEVVRVWHRAVAATAVTTVAVVGNDITVNLRTNAANAVLATADEVTAAVNATPAALALLFAASAGAGVTASTVGLTALDALVDAVAASFDVALGAEAFEDFEEGWAGTGVTQVLITSFPQIGTPPGPHAFDRLRVAMFDADVLLGSYNAATGAYIDGAAMPNPPVAEEVSLVIPSAPPSVPWVASGDFTLDVAYLPAATLSIPDEVLTGVTRLGTSIQADVAALTDVTDVTESGGADSFTAGQVLIQGGRIAETFEGTWTLVL